MKTWLNIESSGEEWKFLRGVLMISAEGGQLIKETGVTWLATTHSVSSYFILRLILWTYAAAKSGKP